MATGAVIAAGPKGVLRNIAETISIPCLHPTGPYLRRRGLLSGPA